MTRIPQNPRFPGRSRGFTLLEVLLAFVVFALSFATVLEILSGSMRSTMRARSYSEAALAAQSLMDMVGTEIPLYAGSLGGMTDEGFDWTLEITNFEGQSGDERTMELAAQHGTVLYWVDLVLEWEEGPRTREARFTTVRGVLQESAP